MTFFQAALIGIMSCTAASTIACLGTTVGNYTLNRPLVASLIVGIILGDVQGCILVGIPMQIMWIALVHYCATMVQVPFKNCSHIWIQVYGTLRPY